MSDPVEINKKIHLVMGSTILSDDSHETRQAIQVMEGCIYEIRTWLTTITPTYNILSCTIVNA